jgi:hypothetical protein
MTAVSDPVTMTLDVFDAYDDAPGWPSYVVRYVGKPVGKVWWGDCSWDFIHHGSGINGSVPSRELAGRIVGEMERRTRARA